MNAKLITPILALCCLPLSAKVYTVQSLLGDMVVNINVDKSITWDITKGKTLVLKPSVISLQTDKQIFGVNPKVRKATVHNYKNDDNGGYQQLLLSCNGYDVEFRVYLNAAAYRIIPKKMINKVVNETSEYRFAGDYQSFVPYVMIIGEGSAGVIPSNLIMTRLHCLRCIRILLPLPLLLFAYLKGRRL